MCEYPASLPLDNDNDSDTGLPVVSTREHVTPTLGAEPRKRARIDGRAPLNNGRPSTPSSLPQPPIRAQPLARCFLDSAATRGTEPLPLDDLQWSDVANQATPPSLDSASAIAEHYFATVHDWFAVVSRMRLSRLLANRTALISADHASLILAVHLFSGDGSSSRCTRSTLWNSQAFPQCFRIARSDIRVLACRERLDRALRIWSRFASSGIFLNGSLLPYSLRHGST